MGRWDTLDTLTDLIAAYPPTEQELRAAVLDLGLNMTEWEEARYPDDGEMLNSVVARAIQMREEADHAALRE